MTFKNMKIEISESQPLDGVVKELERLGFNYDSEMSGVHATNCIGTWEDGTYCTYTSMESLEGFKTTTLTQLKEMK